MPSNLQPPPAETPLPFHVATLIDRVCLRFEAAWQQGARPTLAEFHTAVDEEYRPALLAELLKIELHYRRRSGEAPAADEYVKDFGRYAAMVRAVFGDADAVPTVPHAQTPERPEEKAEASEPPTIPGYKITGRLGNGAMGVVYKAEQLSLANRIVALKVISQTDGGEERDSRFRREAELASQVTHDHVVQVYDLGVAQGKPYLCMEFIEGGSLDQLRYQGTPPPQRAAELVEKLARGAHAAHLKKVVHRDLKPANVLMAFDPTEDQAAPAGKEVPWWERRYCPKIADFGLAKLAGDSGLTVAGQIVGTPQYMAPEQAVGDHKKVGPPADTYALGAILYAILLGRAPFEGSAKNVIDQVIHNDPTPPCRLRSEIHPDLEAVCLRCLEKAPARRYATALELAEDLRRFLKGEATKARPRRWYQKAARRATKHPILTAAACLLVLACAVAPFVAPWLDSDRPRKEAKARLARQQPYVFAGDEPLPGPFRRVFQAGGAPKPNAAEGCFSIEAVSESFWELFDAVPVKRYRFTVEVRHDAASGDSVVGLYFAYRTGVTESGKRQGGCHTLTFADRGLVSRPFERKEKRTSRVRFDTPLFEVRAGGISWARGPCGNGLSFRPAAVLARPGPWRTIRVEVFPDRARGLWKNRDGVDEVIEDFTADDFERDLKHTKEANRHLTAVSGQFLPQGGCGLYVFSGEASFRGIVVEPLRDD